MEKGDLTGAEDMLRTTISLDPNGTDVSLAHHTLSEMYHDKGHLEEAEKELREAIKLDPGNFVPHFTLHCVLLDKGDLDGAEKALRKALRIDPEDRGAIAALEQIVENKEIDFPKAK